MLFIWGLYYIMSNSSDASGYVYVLTSPNSEYIKIGGTTMPPMKRINEINMTEPYKSHGPWSLYDFRGVTDWRVVEQALHYVFRSMSVHSIIGQRELFSINPHQASIQLDNIAPNTIVDKPKIDRMFMDTYFRDYLLRLFVFAGLEHWMDLQGGWTLSIFTSTVGGRYFTINIAKHEVAFSTLSKKEREQVNMLYMDSLILDFDETVQWVETNDGDFFEGLYKTALPHSIGVGIPGTFDKMQKFLSLPGVRRAIVAYWTECLLKLKDTNSLSLFARYHNYNAVAVLAERWRKGKTV